MFPYVRYLQTILGSNRVSQILEIFFVVLSVHLKKVLMHDNMSTGFRGIDEKPIKII